MKRAMGIAWYRLATFRILGLAEEPADPEYEGPMIGFPGGYGAAERLAGILERAEFEEGPDAAQPRQEGPDDVLCPYTAL